LQTNLHRAHTAQEQAIEAKQNAEGREKQLKQVEQVQPTRTLVDRHKAAVNQMAEKTSTLQQIQITLNSLKLQREELDKQLQTANEAATVTIQKQEAAVPYLEEAKALDVQIKEKAEQVNQAAIQVKITEGNHQQLQQQLQTQQEQSEILRASIQQLRQWKQDNNARQAIAENYALVSSKLGDAETLLDAAQAFLPQLESTQTTIAEAKRTKNELVIKSAAIAQYLQEEKRKHTTIAEALAAISIESAESEKAAIDSSIEDMIAAEVHWKIVIHSEAEMDILKQMLSGNKSELNDKSRLLTQASEQLVIATASRDASLRMLHKARLAAAENVELLRSQLVPEEPCPVCGSKDHPYLAGQPQLNHVLAELEAAHQQNDNTYATYLQAESSLKETVNSLKEAIGRKEAEISNKEALLAAHQKTWQGFAIYAHASEVSWEQKATWLVLQLQAAKAQQRSLQQQIQLYAAKKQELDLLQNSRNELERQQNEISNAIKDTVRRLESLEEQEARYRKEQQNNNQALATIEKSLSAYFTAPSWFANWKADSAVFLQQICHFTELWKSNMQKLEGDVRQQDILMATCEATKEQLQNASVDMQKKKTALDSVVQMLYTLTQRRKAIFEGKAILIVEQGLKQAAKAAQQACEKIRSNCELLQISLTRIDTQKEQAEKDIMSLQQQAESFHQKIREWLTVFNSQNALVLDEDQLLQLLAYDTGWIEAERAALRAIDNTLTQSQSVLQERSTQMQQHEQKRVSERSADELTDLLNTVKTNLQEQVQRKNEIDFRLQQDLANNRKIGDLLCIIKAKEFATENWAKLNEIIGSADGKKFRLIAQEYTLDVLLGYANKHLAMLSNRYLLQRIPNTLGLQVVDQDMGDEVRTVYSLSGGESFLVSLALALGLASLSSSRMQVESLFIDEGFGSLDPVTLNIAMDALERLHNQGRKVGVISHVQEMTERIPVQIKVSKQQSGRSKVEVI